jgi:hypothetical protein
MPIPTVISDLSPIIGTGPAPNGGQPGGGENPSTFDDYLRAYGAFIAQLRAGSGFANSGAFRIPFFDASGAWSSSADFVRDGSGNVGIGTSATGARLTVNGNINTGAGGRIGSLAQTDVSTVAGASVANYGATFGALFTGMASGGTALSGYDGLLFVTFGTERMRIDVSGHQINTPGSTTPPTLTVNGQLNITPTSNTNVRISFRGTDGVTRVANITLA